MIGQEIDPAVFLFPFITQRAFINLIISALTESCGNILQVECK